MTEVAVLPITMMPMFTPFSSTFILNLSRLERLYPDCSRSSLRVTVSFGSNRSFSQESIAPSFFFGSYGDRLCVGHGGMASSPEAEPAAMGGQLKTFP